MVPACTEVGMSLWHAFFFYLASSRSCWCTAQPAEVHASWCQHPRQLAGAAWRAMPHRSNTGTSSGTRHSRKQQGVGREPNKQALSSRHPTAHGRHFIPPPSVQSGSHTAPWCGLFLRARLDPHAWQMLHQLHLAPPHPPRASRRPCVREEGGRAAQLWWCWGTHGGLGLDCHCSQRTCRPGAGTTAEERAHASRPRP